VEAIAVWLLSPSFLPASSLPPSLPPSKTLIHALPLFPPFPLPSLPPSLPPYLEVKAEAGLHCSGDVGDEGRGCDDNRSVGFGFLERERGRVRFCNGLWLIEGKGPPLPPSLPPSLPPYLRDEHVTELAHRRLEQTHPLNDALRNKGRTPVPPVVGREGGKEGGKEVGRSVGRKSRTRKGHEGKEREEERRKGGREGGRDQPKVGGGLAEEVLGAVARPCVKKKHLGH